MGEIYDFEKGQAKEAALDLTQKASLGARRRASDAGWLAWSCS